MPSELSWFRLNMITCFIVLSNENLTFKKIENLVIDLKNLNRVFQTKEGYQMIIIFKANDAVMVVKIYCVYILYIVHSFFFSFPL